jgi:alpha-glucosidase (family GH31 glycosyl hydrolase)
MNKRKISDKMYRWKGTLDMDCVHYENRIQYNVHNLHGYMEARASKEAMEKIKNERALGEPFGDLQLHLQLEIYTFEEIILNISVISRSTYAGSGSRGGHWTGKNVSLQREIFLIFLQS